jgi:excisionase family DNA binding protein
MKTEILTIDEVAEYLKLKLKTAYALVARGDIPGFKVGGQWRFRKSEIDRWIKEQEKRAVSKAFHEDFEIRLSKRLLLQAGAPTRNALLADAGVLIPQIEKEVNEGKNFANLRQVYSGMILAAWYKRALKDSLLSKIYADKSKVKGVDQDPKTNQEIEFSKSFLCALTAELVFSQSETLLNSKPFLKL